MSAYILLAFAILGIEAVLVILGIIYIIKELLL